MILTTATVIILIFIISYAIGLVYHKIVEKIVKKCTDYCCNNSAQIKKSAEKVIQEYENSRCYKSGLKDDVFNTATAVETSKKDRHCYYKAYYYLMEKQSLNNIPTLETQVAFIKNIIPIIMLYIVYFCCCDSIVLFYSLPCCMLPILLFLLGIGLLLTCCCIQNKIYKLVWEGYIYLHV